MVTKNKTNGEGRKERRIHWRDRRLNPDRRNAVRLRRAEFDCRSGIPRRQSDIGGDLADGAVWWEEGSTYL